MDHQYYIAGSPLNYLVLSCLKNKQRHEQQIRINSYRIDMMRQHNDKDPWKGPLSMDIKFVLDKRIQHHEHYMPASYTIYNLIRFVQKITEGIIYTPNANIDAFTGHITFEETPMTLITIRLK